MASITQKDYHTTLSLARMGALDQAETAYQAYHLDQDNNSEDCLALGARLLKDRARLLSGDAKQKKII